MSRPGQQRPRVATVPSLVAELRQLLFGWALDPIARREWCRRQRRSLRIPGHFVVWVRRETMPWAEWGARRGYFELERMDGLAYLRALGAVTPSGAARGAPTPP
jgi:hypothetical protein